MFNADDPTPRISDNFAKPITTKFDNSNNSSIKRRDQKNKIQNVHQSKQSGPQKIIKSRHLEIQEPVDFETEPDCHRNSLQVIPPTEFKSANKLSNTKEKISNEIEPYARNSNDLKQRKPNNYENKTYSRDSNNKPEAREMLKQDIKPDSRESSKYENKTYSRDLNSSDSRYSHEKTGSYNSDFFSKSKHK